MIFETTVEGGFSAAHSIIDYPGNCEKMHGHNWKVLLSVRTGATDSLGLTVDFRVLKKLLKDALSELDHSVLNELPYFTGRNPTTENIALYIHEKLKENQAFSGLALGGIRVYESETSYVNLIP